MYVYQIEVSNICSLKCSYCPHPQQKRKKGFMTFDTFKKCVELYKNCENKNHLALHNFGEVLLHPRLHEFIEYAHDNSVKCRFFTNGVRSNKIPFKRDFWKKLVEHGLEEVHFSAHELSTKEFLEITDGLLKVNHIFDPKKNRLGSWAGQTGPAESTIDLPCIFERKNAFVVLWNGRISSCCLDVEGLRSDLWIDDILRDDSYKFEHISLCNSCASMRNNEDM